jgi:hypothetical protein
MFDNDQAVPAGGGESVSVNATSLQPMTAEAAAGLLSSWSDDDDTPSVPADLEPDDDAQAVEPEPEGEGDEAEPEAVEGEDEPEEGEENTDEEEQTPEQSEPEGYDWDKVPGEAKFRLRDGTVVTAAEVKKRWDALSNAEQESSRISAEKQQFERQQAQAAQQYQQFLPVAQQALAAIQASLPQVPNAPDPSLASTDPIRYVEERARYDGIVNEYNAKVGQMRAIAAQAQNQQQRAQAEQKQRLDGYIEEQRNKLYEALPDLRDPAKRQEFHREFIDGGAKHYGFAPDELNQVFDSRLMVMARDALAYRKMMAKGAPKPTPAKPATAQAPVKTAPVALGGRRETSNEQQATRKDKLMSDARKKGALTAREAAQLLSQINP